MNFFERQAAARRSSSRLVVLFALAVIGIVLAVDFAAWLAWAVGSGDKEPGEVGALLVFSTLVTVGVIGLGSLYRIASLRGGGEPVALQMGGVPVPENTTDTQLRRLRNVVEEIAIASGVPVPKIYVLEHEAAINAFAAGYSPSDAVVAVTRGALETLEPRRVAGRDRARVQPHPQRRHAPEHPPDGRAVRHPDDRPDRPQDPASTARRPRQGRRCDARRGARSR